MTEFTCATPALAALAYKCRQLAIEQGVLSADPTGLHDHYTCKTPRLLIHYCQDRYMVVYVGHVRVADFNAAPWGSSCHIDPCTAWLMVDMAACGIELLTSVVRVQRR